MSFQNWLFWFMFRRKKKSDAATQICVDCYLLWTTSKKVYAAPPGICRFLSQVILFSNCHSSLSVPVSPLLWSWPRSSTQISPVLTYVPMQCGTSTSALNSVRWSLSSPSNPMIPSVSHSSALVFQINTFSGKWQNEPENRGSDQKRWSQSQNCWDRKPWAAHWDWVPLKWLRTIHKQPGEDNTPKKQVVGHGWVVKA